MFEVEILHADESRLHVKKRSRDFQRSKVYKAEREAFASDPIGSLPTLRSMDELKQFVQKVYSHPKVFEYYPKAISCWTGIDVTDGRGRRSACANEFGISVPLRYRRPWVVLHEMAHTIERRVYGHLDGWHSQNFCGVYLNLVRIMLGRESHEALCRSFAKHGVKVREHEPHYKMKKTSKSLAFDS